MLPAAIKAIHVVLVKATQYGRDGYPVTFRKQLMPSNSLSVMFALTKDTLIELELCDYQTSVWALDSGVRSQQKKIEELFAELPRKNTLTILALVGVQTNQFPYARDLIRQWQEKGAKAAIGGFHVSGTITTMLYGIAAIDKKRKDVPSPHLMPPEIQELLDQKVVVFAGEAEGIWGTVLMDIIQGKKQYLYDTRDIPTGTVPFSDTRALPDLVDAPFPQYPPGHFENLLIETCTIDLSRGCPFACSFCAIINVLGRTVRARSVEETLRFIEDFCQEHDGTGDFFFTDDNFGRHPWWRELLAGIRELRKQYNIRFRAEADLATAKLEGFFEMLADAGCFELFMGVESLRQETLKATHKGQNRVATYAATWQRMHDLGMRVHAGYILGFPDDTPETLREDIQRLHDLGVDVASFFILTPLPGSEDHARMLVAGDAMDPDLNNYDSFAPVCDHPKMSRQEWKDIYDESWKIFYTPENMIAALRRFKTTEAQSSLLAHYIWHRWSKLVEGFHPMMGGWGRCRSRKNRRPGMPIESRWMFFFGETRRYLRYLPLFLRELMVFQRVLLDSGLAAALVEERYGQLAKDIGGIRGWATRTFGRHLDRSWLHEFWQHYSHTPTGGPPADQMGLSPVREGHIRKWSDHLLIVPYAFAELVYRMKYLGMFPKILRLITAK